MEHVKGKSTAEPDQSEEQEEGCSSRAKPSSALCVSTNSDLPGSSANSYRDKLQEGFSNRCGMSLANDLNAPFTKPYSAIDDHGGKGNAAGEFIRRDFEIPASLSSSNNGTEQGLFNHRQKDPWQRIFQLGGGIKSRNFGGILSSCKEETKDAESLHNDQKLKLKPLISTNKQKNKSLDGALSSSLADGRRHKLTSSYDRQPHANDHSKILRSSSFTNFFRNQSRKDKTAECADDHPVVHHHEPHSAASSIQCEKQPTFVQLKNSTQANSKCQPSSQNTDKITLREWLNSGTCELKKVERLRLFKTIVELVDVAHCEGIGLIELRPCKFIFASPSSIKYTGSSAAVGFMMHGRREMVVKKQKLIGKDTESIRRESQFISACCTRNETTGQHSSQLEPETVELEKKWYACPEEIHSSGLLSSNIYSLGTLLFEVGQYSEVF